MPILFSMKLIPEEYTHLFPLKQYYPCFKSPKFLQIIHLRVENDYINNSIPSIFMSNLIRYIPIMTYIIYINISNF